MKRILFVYNPNSGRGKIKRNAHKIAEMYRSEGYDVTPYATKAPLDAQNKVSSDAHNYDLVVCAGGDGTLSEVVSGIMEAKRRVPIGFIPAGSTNDTRHGFRLPKDMKSAAKVCVEGIGFQTDVGKINDDYFTYVASVGSLSAVSCFTSQDMKRLLGHGAYVIEGIKQLIKMESFNMTIEFNDHVISGEFFLGMITNAISVGGFEGITGQNVDLQDGLFEVVMLRKPANIIEFNRQIDMILIHNDDSQQLVDDVIVRFKTDKVIFKSDTPVQWVRDGENGGKHRLVEIEVCNKAVTIMTDNK